jgi:hypothetical protein
VNHETGLLFGHLCWHEPYIRPLDSFASRSGIGCIVEMVQVAVELVESMDCGQELVAIT